MSSYEDAEVNDWIVVGVFLGRIYRIGRWTLLGVLGSLCAFAFVVGLHSGLTG